MKPTRNKAPPRIPRKTPSKFKDIAKDPVKVYCRIRPIQLDNEVSCMQVVSPSTVQLVPPESAVKYRHGVKTAIQYTFKRVFGESASQREVFKEVALPLVEDLILGRNGLLFTYGVPGCGKTFTMTGEPNNGGIMPRCLNVLFNSISEFQANKFVFKPDGMNGFHIQCESDAKMDLQNELQAGSLTKNTSKTLLKRKYNDSKFQQSYDSTKIENIEEDNTYAVFVTYVEIYNNSVYDLLEDVNDEVIRTKSLQTKIVREDASRNMYVNGVTEIEVKSTKEAFDWFYLGQKRKRMAHTTLNAESSRNHSVFTIRLVQAPMDDTGEHVIHDKKVICISQLSMVDLAGSERINRTKNSGQSLREAGHINNSLITLGNCLKILRENHLQGTNKIVPYRDSRVTHLFKNFFDGGQIRMVVCVNPRTDDYDETVQVMKFAEITSEVQIARPHSSKNIDLDLMRGRRNSHQILKQAIQRMQESGNEGAENLEVDLGIDYSLGPAFPALLMQNSSDSQIVPNLVACLEDRMNRRSLLIKDIKAKEKHFRNKLINVEKENILTKQDVNSLKTTLDQERKKTALLESRLMNTDAQNSNALRNVDATDMEIITLRQEVEEEDMLLNQTMFGLRRKSNQILKQAIQRMQKSGNEGAESLEVDLGIDYSLGPAFPALLMQTSSDSQIVPNLVACLEDRMNRRSLLIKDIKAKEEDFRNKLMNVLKENIFTKQDVNILKITLDQEQKKTALLESRLMNTNAQNSNALRNVDAIKIEIRTLRQEVEEEDMLLNQTMLERKKIKHKYSGKIAKEKVKISREIEQKLKDHKAELKNKIRDKMEKLRHIKRTFEDNTESTLHSTASSQIGNGKYEVSMYTTNTSENNVLPSQIFPESQTARRAGPPVSNPRHRCSPSANGDVWIDHRPAVPVQLGAIPKSYIKRYVSVTKLTEVKDVTSQASWYCHTTQEQDTDGDIETRLAKGDVVPTTGEGAQVIYNDVEILRQESPTSPRKRKSFSESNSSFNPSDTQSKCAISIEGYGKRQRNK